MSVLLLHSSGLSGRQWKRLLSDIDAAGLRGVAPDLIGHGGEDPWPEPKPFSFRMDVERIVAMLRESGPSHVVGHSYGGLLALQVALAVPELISSLVLFDPVAFGVLDAKRDADARALLDALDLSWSVGRERWLETFVGFWGGGGAWAALPEDVRVEFRRVAWVVEEGVRTLGEDVTPASAYSVFAFPTTLMTGEISPLPARRAIERLAEAIPIVRIRTISGAGHLAPVTHAKAVNPLIIDAIATRRD
jgi:pimeloyl-ACP methyl ester carboxylesterase